MCLLVEYNASRYASGDSACQNCVSQSVHRRDLVHGKLLHWIHENELTWYKPLTSADGYRRGNLRPITLTQNVGIIVDEIRSIQSLPCSHSNRCQAAVAVCLLFYSYYKLNVNKLSSVFSSG